VIVACLLGGSKPAGPIAPAQALEFVPVNLVEPAKDGTPGPSTPKPSAQPRPRLHRGRNLARQPPAPLPALVPTPPAASSLVALARAVPAPDEDEAGDEIPDESPAAENGGASGSAGATPVPEVRRISPLEAAYLRTYQTFPSLPRALWVRGRVYTETLRICVSADGHVDEVALEEGAAPELDALVVAAVRTWRYRAPLVGGRPIPFCHPMRIHYEFD
jgi:TonB family protein